MKETLKKMTLTSEYQSKVCPDCGEQLYQTIRGYTVPIMCSCQKERYEIKRKEMELKERSMKLNRIRDYSMMDKQFEDNTFENFIVNASNEKSYKLGKNYVENWQKMKEENIGLLLYGDPGVGKTFLTNCIANELLNNLTPVIVISSIGIINRVFDGYGKFGSKGEHEIIRELNNADLLIIDDLGAEHTQDKGKQIIYSIIDERSRNNKPMIVTTNLSPNGLRDKITSSDGIARTADRLFSSCYPIEIKGASQRRSQIPKKEKIIKEILLES